MSYSAEVLADSPLAYWRLGESDFTMTDSSGNGRNGTYSNVLPAPSLTTDPDKSTAFLGGASHAMCAAAPWMDTSTITLETWAQGSVSTIAGLLDRDRSDGRCWQFRLESDGRASFIAIGGAGGIVQCSTPAGVSVNDGEPHHIVATYDGAHIVLYFDGQPVATLPRSGTLPSTSPSPLALAVSYGGTGSSSFYPYNGRLDEVAIYGTALTADRIQAHYEAGIAPAGSIGGVWGWIG